MRICFFQPHPTYGSIEEYLSIIINGLNPELYDITLFCPDAGQTNKLLAQIKNNIRIIRYPKIKNGVKEIFYLYRQFRKIGPDTVHFNDPCPRAMIAAHLAGVRYRVLTYHTPTLKVEYNWQGRLAWKMAFDKNLNIIATSISLKTVMAERYGLISKKITVINYGLTADKLKANINRQETRKALGLSQDAFILINVARLCKQKSQDTLIKSIAYLPKDIYDRINLLIAGSGELHAELKMLIGKLNLQNKVFLLGHRQDIPDVLNCSDLFVLSSSFEGACFALIEAMAMGLPIVATDIDGVRDTILDNVTGMLIPRNNPEKLALAVSELCRDKEKRLMLGNNGKKRFHEEFRSEKMIQRTEKYYEELAGG